jgi:hypothetical protein
MLVRKTVFEKTKCMFMSRLQTREQNCYMFKAVGVAQSVQCLTADWTVGVRSLTEAEDFSSSLCVQSGSGVHPASSTIGTGGSFPGGKARTALDADHSSPFSAEIKKE